VILAAMSVVSGTASAYADSVPELPFVPDSLLREIVVTSGPRRRMLDMRADGSFGVDAAFLSEQPSLMGSADPVSLLRTLPAVATANDLQASFSVRGASSGSNLYEADGVRIVNPLHLLGLYSAFNPAFYRRYAFRPGGVPATVPNLTSGYLSAFSGAAESPDTVMSGTLAIGLIESHAAIRVPLRNLASSVAVGVRRTYLDLVFPDILRLGDSSLDYVFTDINAAVTSRVTSDAVLALTFFGSRDNMALLNDKAGRKDGEFGWTNLAAGASFVRPGCDVSLGLTRYANTFRMTEGGRSLDLPSSLTQASGRAAVCIGEFTVGSDVTYRYTSGQRNVAAVTPAASDARSSAELNLAAVWTHTLMPGLDISAGLRMSLYHCRSYNAFVPMPRVSLTYAVAPQLRVFASYGRYVRFDRLVSETASGLPADYWTTAVAAAPYEDVHSASAGISGLISPLAVRFSVEGYCRRISRSAEFAGTLLDMVNPSFRPDDNIILGRGYSAGLSVTAMRQVGALRGRLSYNWGVSRLRFDRYGADYVPSAHDRPHDFNVTLSYTPPFISGSPLTLASSYTYATGTPYTRARLGYMIGENLICEYYPHNSSRLPAYKRLDLSVGWRFSGRSGRHTLGVSVYNLLANHNTLFVYTSYSIDTGISQRQSVMKSVIPSVNYTYEF